jgi:hypothetical protein
VRLDTYCKREANILRRVPLPPTLHQNAELFQGFKPLWNQAIGSLTPDSLSSPENSADHTHPNKRIRLDDDADDMPADALIEIHLDEEKDDIDIVTLHNIVYYLYTGCVNIKFPLPYEDDFRYVRPVGFPPPADPYLLYKNARKFLIDGLTHHTFEVLWETLRPENVIDRLFSGPNDLRLCDEVVECISIISWKIMTMSNFLEIGKQWIGTQNVEKKFPSSAGRWCVELCSG